MKIKSVLMLALIFTLIFNSLGINNTFSASEVETYLIGIKDEVDLDSFIEKNNLKDNKVKKIKGTSLIISTLTQSDAMKLQNSPYINFIEEDGSVEVTSIGEIKEPPASKKIKDEETIPWGMKEIGVDLTLKKNLDGKNIKIAVIDTGISNHPDLKISGGVSFVEGTTSYSDDNGHGTHVAGTVAALHNNIGVAGSGSNSDIFAVKVLNENGTGSISQVIQGLEWATENQMDIISMSLGTLENSRALYEAVLKAHNNGILIIAAAGNRGTGDNTLLYPANYPEVLSVGATDETHKKANFSSTGPLLDLVAPGVDILSTTKNGDYGILSGTSMATPHVTGAAATIWSKNKKLTNDEEQNILEQTATPLGEQQKYGHGIVNLAKAVGIVDGPLFTPIPVIEQPNQENDTNEPFNIIEFDKNILSLSNHLNKLKEQALLENKIDLAKEIENKFNDLLVRNAALHRIPNENSILHKNDTNFTTLMNQHHTSNIPKYKQIQKEYEELIVNYFSNLNAISGQNVSIEAYNYVGDYQRIYPGQSATVSLNLYESKTWVDVRVYDIANNVVASTTYYNQPANVPIAFTWSTASNTPPGAYLIKYTYSGNAIVDTFIIHVDQPSQPLPPPYSSLLLVNSPVDVSTVDGEYKVFQFTPTTSGEFKFFTGPYGGSGATNDTYLEIYTDSGLSSKIAENDDSNGSLYSEIKIYLQAGITYYVKLRNYQPTSAVHARLTVTNTPTIETISLNSPIDTSVVQGSYKIFSFTAPQSGLYRFSTSPYGGGSTTSDTYLHLYQDQNLSTQISSDDDSGEGYFSLMKFQLSAGQTYYIKFRGYNDSSSSARLVVNLIPYQNIQLQIKNGTEPISDIDGEFARLYDDGTHMVSSAVLDLLTLKAGTD